MNHEDHSVSVVTIILNPSDAHMLPHVLAVLKQAEVTVNDVDEANGAITATADTATVKDLEKVHLFEYIRTNFSFWYHEPRLVTIDDEVGEPT